MNPKKQYELYRIIPQMIVGLAGALLIYAIHEKFNVPIAVLASPVLSLIMGYILYVGRVKFKFRHKFILTWMTLGFFIFFCYSTYKYIQVGNVQYTFWHIIFIIFPMFFACNVEKQYGKRNDH